MQKILLIHSFSPVNAWLLIVYGTAFDAIITTSCNCLLLVGRKLVDVDKVYNDFNVIYADDFKFYHILVS